MSKRTTPRKPKRTPKPAPKRKPAHTKAWFALDRRGRPVLCCVERTLRWHISSFPTVKRRAQFRLVPVWKGKR